MIRRITIALSVNTHTPIPYWLSLPLAELHEYMKELEALNKK
ncbi:hypothetical protein KLER11_gp19 [Pararheinheimera phage vB_PsoM_KLER1-1]|nr:hypothetical protein KLER11_gp19 [Pararheinheimera phage vB_PsoM_KLER1-1]